MRSVVQQAAAPVVGAASRPAAAPPCPESQAAYFELCRAQSAKYDADRAFWEVRDNYYGPDRKQRKRAARQAQEAARLRYAAAAQAYHASPRGRAEAAARAAYNARYGTHL